MAEQVHPGEPERNEAVDTADQPVLSRYARWASGSPNPQPARTDPRPFSGAAVEADGVRISAQSEGLRAGRESPARSGNFPSEPTSNVEPGFGASEVSPLSTGGREPPAAPKEAMAPLRPTETVRRVEASEVQTASSGATTGAWTRAVTPIPSEPTRERSEGKKLPFWKRFALPRVPGTTGSPSASAPNPPSLEPILTRLNALEKQLAANQSATETQLSRFEENITRLWELEEQMVLTEVRERLALLEANQQEIADGLHSVGRNLSLLAVVLAAGLAAALLALGLLL